MLIGVLSDTHMRGAEAQFARRAAEVFAEAEMILHAGDLVDLAVLDAFAGKRWAAVAGNMDPGPVRHNLPAKQVVEAAGRRIGLIHGGGAPLGLAGRVRREFDDVEAIVFGHSHRPMNAVKDGVLMFNPGSVAKGFMGSGTAGLITVDDQGIQGEIVKFW